jgi:acetylornithine deacetylase/succinyl-diaminopimelate desuccinylase-like protein
MQGRAAFKVVVDTSGGHASMPPTDASHTPAVMARMILAMQKTQPPLFMQSPMTDLLQSAAPHAPFWLRGFLANAGVWCVSVPLAADLSSFFLACALPPFPPLPQPLNSCCDSSDVAVMLLQAVLHTVQVICRPIGQVLKHVWASFGPTANALVRSTAVPTIVNMGVAQNVIPARAEAFVDMRLLQGQGGDVPLQYMQARATEAAMPGARVSVELMQDSGGGIPDLEPSEVSNVWRCRPVQRLSIGISDVCARSCGVCWHEEKTCRTFMGSCCRTGHARSRRMVGSAGASNSIRFGSSGL